MTMMLECNLELSFECFCLQTPAKVSVYLRTKQESAEFVAQDIQAAYVSGAIISGVCGLE